MCEIQEDNIISCQLTFITIGDMNYNDNINNVLEQIKESGLDFKIGEMSTIIKGNRDKIFLLINKICSEMKNHKYLINISISNICGCYE